MVKLPIIATGLLAGIAGKYYMDVSDGGPGWLPTAGRHFAFYSTSQKKLNFGGGLGNQTWQTYALLGGIVVAYWGLRQFGPTVPGHKREDGTRGKAYQKMPNWPGPKMLGW